MDDKKNPEELTTDNDRTASSAPGEPIDEAGEDEQVDHTLVDRALEEPAD